MNRIRALGVATLSIGLLVGCAQGASGPEDANAGTSTATADAYPRTITVPGTPQTQVTIAAKPVRVAALSADVAGAAIELVGAQRLIAVPRSATSATLSNYPQEAAKVETKLPPGTDPDPEQIIALKPDLILITTRHGGEKDARALLAKAGVPVIAIGNNWGTVKAVKENLTLLGEALGAEARAREVNAELDRRVTAVTIRVGTVTSRPSVAILSNQASSPFINAPNVLTSDLVRLAGGDLVAERIGLRGTGPVNAEQLVAAKPDAIILVDVTGRGRESYAALLNNPAVANLEAVRGGRITVIPARLCYGVGGVHVAEGLETIARWLHPGSYP